MRSSKLINCKCKEYTCWGGVGGAGPVAEHWYGAEHWQTGATLCVVVPCAGPQAEAAAVAADVSWSVRALWFSWCVLICILAK